MWSPTSVGFVMSSLHSGYAETIVASAINSLTDFGKKPKANCSLPTKADILHSGDFLDHRESVLSPRRRQPAMRRSPRRCHHMSSVIQLPCTWQRTELIWRKFVSSLVTATSKSPDDQCANDGSGISRPVT